MVLYSFKREDNGEWVQQFHPMGECPQEIICEDGVKAKRGYEGAPAVKWGKGFLPVGEALKRKKDMTKRNEKAGDKGRAYWKSKTPKLVQQS